MQRRSFLVRLSALATLFTSGVMAQATSVAKLVKSPAEWKKLLPAASFKVLFEEATEAPGTSALNGEKRAGTFVCAACNLPLFDSATKYRAAPVGQVFTQRCPMHWAPRPISK